MLDRNVRAMRNDKKKCLIFDDFNEDLVSIDLPLPLAANSLQ